MTTPSARQEAARIVQEFQLDHELTCRPTPGRGPGDPRSLVEKIAVALRAAELRGRQEMRKYAMHLSTCHHRAHWVGSASTDLPPGCTCGLDAALGMTPEGRGRREPRHLSV